MCIPAAVRVWPPTVGFLWVGETGMIQLACTIGIFQRKLHESYLSGLLVGDRCQVRGLIFHHEYNDPPPLGIK